MEIPSAKALRKSILSLKPDEGIYEDFLFSSLLRTEVRAPEWHMVCSFRSMESTENLNEQVAESSLAKGVVGALLGAAVGVGLMFAFFTFAGFRFPLLGVGIGILTALGARLLYKGGDSTLALIASAIALTAVVTTLYLMYGEFPIVSIVSVVVSATLSYRIAAK